MIKDANRGIYILNGTIYDQRPEGELVPAFKAVVTDPKKQKAISCYLHQLAFQTFNNASIHAPYSNGTMPNAIKGFDSLVSLEMDKLGVPVLFTFGHSLVHDLQVSPDGKTATITQSITADLAAPGSNMHELNSFGQVSFSQRFVIDLTAEIPTVIDLKISQTIS